MSTKKKIGILGASGYTGADAVRLLARHPNAEITALTANTHAGKSMNDVFPHFFMLDLPKLVEWEKVNWSQLDAVLCGLTETAVVTLNTDGSRGETVTAARDEDFREALGLVHRERVAGELDAGVVAGDPDVGVWRYVDDPRRGRISDVCRRSGGVGHHSHPPQRARA